MVAHVVLNHILLLSLPAAQGKLQHIQGINQPEITIHHDKVGVWPFCG